jgi:PKD repeat protein
MTRSRTVLATLAALTFAIAIHAEEGHAVKHRATTSSATLFFSGSFSYTVGSGKARVTAQDVTNNNGTTTGPLRFSLWWTPNGPFPSAGGTNTAHYDLGTLGPNSHLSNVDSGLTLPFTDPGNGCYYVALVLEQFVGGVWQTEDYGNFSLRISSGQGCLFSFTGSPLTIAPGGSSMLSWSSGGTSVSIDNGVGFQGPNGSTSVSPASTTTYTLTVNGTADSSPRTGQVTITVSAAPTATFSASPTTIAAGASSALTWTSANATSVTIDHGVGAQPLSGTTNVSPSTTTTYTLTASGPGGQVTKTATVTIAPAPTIAFSASPNVIGSGQSSTLNWTTTNATSVSIDHGLGAQPLSGSTSVSPSSTTTYTLTATGPGGQLTSQATVTISGGPAVTFTANPTTISPGQSSTLSWTTTNATSVSIDNGIGSKPLGGSVTVSPSVSTSYILTAIGPSGTTTVEARVTVATPPTVNATATPGQIPVGGSSTISWSSSGAVTVVIDHGIGLVTLGGSRVVSPSSTTTYTVTASNVAGSAEAKVTIVVGAVGKRRAVRH